MLGVTNAREELDGARGVDVGEESAELMPVRRCESPEKEYETELLREGDRGIRSSKAYDEPLAL